MRLNHGISEQPLHDSLKSQFLSNKIVQSVRIFRISAASCQQFKPEILVVKVCPELEKLRRCGIQMLDMIVRYHSGCLNAAICIVTHSRHFRLKLRSRRVVQPEVVLTARSCLLHVSTRLDDGQRKSSQSGHKAVHLCLSFSQPSHEHEARGTRLSRVDRHLRTLFCRI